MAQPRLQLALAMSAFKAIGEYDAQIREFEAKATADKTFDWFRPFIVNKFAKRSKQNKTKAKSVSFGIADSAVATDIPDEDIQAAEAAWAITKVANALQAAQDKQNECMMDMFKQMMATLGNKKQATTAPNPNPGNPTNTGSHHKPCKHCNLKHGRLDSQC